MYSFNFLLVCFINLWAPCSNRPSQTSGVQYLMKYGYLNANHEESSRNPYQVYKYAPGLRKFQRIYNLPPTGKFDAPTLAFMSKPRCGNSDLNLINGRRKKRYVLIGYSWQKHIITYKLSSYSNDLDQCIIDKEISRAFKNWADVSGLRFLNAADLDIEEADSDIKFGRLDHGDSANFDGKGGVLAHAFRPGLGLGGDAHFDDDEDFTSNTYEGSNLYQLALHEFGHTIGLGHSDDSEAIMFAYYLGYNPEAGLANDDIAGVQALYGENKELSDITKTVCENALIDAVLSRDDGEILVFVGEYVFKVDNNEVYDEYPKKFEDVYPGLPSNIDAAVQDGYTNEDLFFKGDTVYSYIDNIFVKSEKIYDRIKNAPIDIDSAVKTENDIYLMKNNEYFALQNNNKDVANIEGTHMDTLIVLNAQYLYIANFSASFRYPGSSDTYYFFIKTNTYKYRIIEGEAKLYYYGDTGIWWFGCPAKEVETACPDITSRQNRSSVSPTSNQILNFCLTLFTFIYVLKVLNVHYI